MKLSGFFVLVVVVVFPVVGWAGSWCGKGCVSQSPPPAANHQPQADPKSQRQLPQKPPSPKPQPQDTPKLNVEAAPVPVEESPGADKPMDGVQPPPKPMTDIPPTDEPDKFKAIEERLNRIDRKQRHMEKRLRAAPLMVVSTPAGAANFAEVLKEAIIKAFDSPELRTKVFGSPEFKAAVKREMSE